MALAPPDVIADVPADFTVFAAASQLGASPLRCAAFDLLAHPKCGASWEGCALRDVLRRTAAGRDEASLLGRCTQVSSGIC